MTTQTASIFGNLVYVTSDVPKMKLSADCPVSQEFRIEMDAWLLEFFGTSNVFEDGKVVETAHALHMNPRTLAQLKASEFGIRP